MDFVTVGREYFPGKTVKIFYQSNDNFYDVTPGQRYILSFISQGICKLDIDGTSLLLNAPCIACFNEKEPVILKHTNNAVIQSLYFHPSFVNFKLDFEKIRMNTSHEISDIHDCYLFAPFVNRGNGFNGILPVNPAIYNRINHLFVSAGEELLVQRDWYWSCRCRSYFMELLFAMERIYTSLSDQSNQIKAKDISLPPGYDDMENVLIYLHTNYHQAIQISDLIRQFGTNRTTLSKRFKSATGYSIIDYLNRYRSQLAISLLTHTNLHVSEIGQRLGITDVTHFSRIFRKYIGMPPQRYREVQWGKAD